MANKAIQYAEETLGVHEIFVLAKEHRDKLDTLFTHLAEKEDQRRKIDDRIADRDMQIVSEERSKHVDVSQAALDRLVKESVRVDPEHTALRVAQRDLTDDIEGLRYDVRIVERDITISTARMTELGGYLQYLAACKVEALRLTATNQRW